jgi:hypothetical protein
MDEQSFRKYSGLTVRFFKSLKVQKVNPSKRIKSKKCQFT